MGVAIAARRPIKLNVERRYYMAMTLAILACVVLGFSRSFFLRPFFPAVHAPMEIYFYIHGAIFTLWLGLFVTQVSLIGSRNVGLHMRLGVTGFVLVPVMVAIAGVGAVIAAARPGGFIDVPVPPLQFLTVPLCELALFGGFAGLGLLWRKTPQAHKRLMLLAAIALMEAAMARWQFEPYLSSPAGAFWTQNVFLLPMIGWDFYSRGRLHPVTIWGRPSAGDVRAIARCAVAYGGLDNLRQMGDRPGGLTSPARLFQGIVGLTCEGRPHAKQGRPSLTSLYQPGRGLRHKEQGEPERKKLSWT